MTLQLRSTLAALLVSSLVMGCGGGGGGSPPTDVVLDESYYTNKYGYAEEDSFLGRGLNMGNYLEADATTQCPAGEGCWTNGRTIDEEQDFEDIKAAGFKSVRIPIRWSDHAATTAPYTIDTAWMNRVRAVVEGAIAADLIVVINTHHYVEMMEQPGNLATHRARLAAIWDQISEAFPVSSYPADALVFELLNEPNGAVGYTQWNQIIAQLTGVIWTDNAATQTGRKIMVGTANWGGPTGLANLTLPGACNPTNTIITIHWYEPFHFTHQGADWVNPPGSADAWIGTIWRGTAAEQQPLLDLYESVEDWNADQALPYEVFVGEFGVYGEYAGAAYRKAWTAFIAREAEARGWSWGYWEYDQSFGAYDRANTRWRPEIIEALIPVEAEPPPPVE